MVEKGSKCLYHERMISASVVAIPDTCLPNPVYRAVLRRAVLQTLCNSRGGAFLLIGIYSLIKSEEVTTFKTEF